MVPLFHTHTEWSRRKGEEKCSLRSLKSGWAGKKKTMERNGPGSCSAMGQGLGVHVDIYFQRNLERSHSLVSKSGSNHFLVTGSF